MQHISYNQVYNYKTRMSTYPNITAIVGQASVASTALGYAMAEVLFLPQAAVTIDSLTSYGSVGAGVGDYSTPSTIASLTVLYQGSGLTITALMDAFYEAIGAVSNRGSSPLGNALTNHGFPDAYHICSINGYITDSSSPVLPSPPGQSPIAAPSSGSVSPPLFISSMPSYAPTTKPSYAPNATPLPIYTPSPSFISIPTPPTRAPSNSSAPTISPSSQTTTADNPPNEPLGAFVTNIMSSEKSYS